MDYINLAKDQQINLTKNTGETLTKVSLGLGWDPGKYQTVDCDAYAFPVLNSGYVDTHNIIYFGRKDDKFKAMHHSGDDLTGESSCGGDDERIEIDLTRIPNDWDRIIVGMNIYHGKRKGQCLENLDNCYIRLVDRCNNNCTICRYDLNHDIDQTPTFTNTIFGGIRLKKRQEGSTGVIFGELYRNYGCWTFRAIGHYIQSSDPTSFTNKVQEFLNGQKIQ